MFSEIKQFSDRLEGLNTASGSCIKSAMYHVEKAEGLSNIDQEMSVFRLITAEEEAATAILLMLKEHGYSGSEKLNKNNHLHKQCLYSYVCAVSDLLSSHLKMISNHPPILEWVKVEGRDAIKLGIKISLEDQGIIAEMNPPLNFQVSKGEELHDFSIELTEFLINKGFNNTVKHLKENANMRNKLLYSDGEKIPNTFTDLSNGKYLRFAKYQLQKINVLVAIYFLTAPYSKKNKAHFVEQALEGYLSVLLHVKGKRL